MEPWLKISILLCIFGVLKEFRPSEPYITKYLINPPMNFTLKQVSNDIFPVGTYSTMASLVVVFLITDLVRYKPVIIFDAMCGIVVFVMLITVRSLVLMQVLEVFYGLFMACEVAYYTYIYAKVDKSHYQEVSAHTRSAYLTGRAISGIVSQIYVVLEPSSVYYLNYVSLVGMVLATIWACFLPPVTSSIYFSRVEYQDNEVTPNNGIENILKKQHQLKFTKCLHHLKKDFYSAFSSLYVVKWMCWWSLATCGYYQVWYYVQVLWEQIAEDAHTPLDSYWNGGIEAACTIFSAVASYCSGKVVLNWKIYGEAALCVCSLGIACVLYLMSQTQMIEVAYLAYVLHTVLFNGMITIANSEIASHLNPDSHGLIFGFTTFMALLFQTLLTISVSSIENERFKFVIYGSYFGILGLCFAMTLGGTIVRYMTSKKKEYKGENSTDSTQVM